MYINNYSLLPHFHSVWRYYKKLAIDSFGGVLSLQGCVSAHLYEFALRNV